MSYIRTKDGVYEVSEKTKYAQYSIRGMTMVKNTDFQYISNEKIIKQSENLEELCDEFIGYVGEEYVKENKTYDMPNFQEYDLKDMLYHMSYNKEDCVVYGAVWCEFGLKYVAKMDNEGKLVLI